MKKHHDQARRSLLAGGAATLLLPRLAFGQAKPVVRIGVPTKTYFPTIIAETAIRQKLFDKEGIECQLTIYRSGAEGFEAVAAGAADLVYNSSSSVAAGLVKGVKSKCVANGGLGYYGWHMMVKPDSPIKKLSELAGKKVGITSAGSGSDILARWTLADQKIEFTRVPLGGGGLVPNLLTGNVDATVLYSPLTYQVMQAKQARSIADFGELRAAAFDGFLDRHRQDHRRAAAGAAEGAQRALRRRRLPARAAEPRGGGEADRGNRRDSRADRRGRAGRQHRQALDDGRIPQGVDGALAGDGQADRHDGAGAGRPDVRQQLQARPDGVAIGEKSGSPLSRG